MPYAVKDKIHFLSEASKILSSSLDYNVTLASIANLAVTNVSDLCVIDILEGSRVNRVVVKAATPSKQKIANKMYTFLPDPRNKRAVFDTAKIGEPILIKKVTKGWLKTVSRIPEEIDVHYKLNLNSIIFTPLMSRRKVIGVLTVASSDKNFSYSKEDAEFIQELAVRAGTAVDKARLYKEAQEAIKTRDEFLSIASHELKTPLTSILLNLQIALLKIQKETKNEEIRKMLEASTRQSKKMTRLIDDLSNISLIETGKMKLEKENGSLSEIIHDAILQFSEKIKKEHIKINFNRNVKIIGFFDPMRIQQVITNLLSNAIKYGNKKPITITLEKNEGEAKIQIIDQGIGIHKKDQEHIFKRFERGTMIEKITGLGVGLYISHQIIIAHGGKITVESKVGKGSTFTITLPLT